MKKYDKVCFIGRFQIPHDGHLSVILEAMKYTHQLIILIGSANRARCPKNPFTFQERKQMLLEMLKDRLLPSSTTITIKPLDDNLYNYESWMYNVQSLVSTDPNESVALIGHYKDDSSYYLKHFNDWDLINCENYNGVSSTDIRDSYFRNELDITQLSIPVANYLLRFKDVKSHQYKYIVEYIEYINNYKQSWKNVPYPVNFITTDAVVVQSGHILVINRGRMPGRGQIALPGGFLDTSETLIDGTIRELREETGLKVPEKVLKGSIVKSNIYDDPNRASRGRVISKATLFKLDDSLPLPKVRGGDDAEKAYWLTLKEFYDSSTNIFSDHLFIVRDLLGI